MSIDARYGQTFAVADSLAVNLKLKPDEGRRVRTSMASSSATTAGWCATGNLDACGVRASLIPNGGIMRVLISVVAAATLSACVPPTAGNDAAADAASDNLEMMADNLEAVAAAMEADATAAGRTGSASGWSYSEDVDKMRGGKNKVASVSATEPIHLPFPYGESTPTLNIRRDTKFGFDIYVSANGQFLCRSYDDDSIAVKFDDGPVRDWRCAEADGGSSDIVFVLQAQKFLSEIKKAREVTIEAPMYEAGRQQMTFKVAGLKW
ncbi:hypothetical protein [Sphingomonas sp. VNH70]|uniref:hypothetical protein n=1 Tax=Sphingomonas silueang TaxID=3156617 RepID=UPI0032B4C261